MEKFLGLEYAEGLTRRDFLEANCEAVEEVSYTRRFSADEMNAHRVMFSNISEKIEDLNQEKKDYLSNLKETMKPLLIQRREILSSIKSKSEQVSESCYKMIDREAKEVGFYNGSGELVYSRPILPDEMQTTIFHTLSRTGTED